MAIRTSGRWASGVPRTDAAGGWELPTSRGIRGPAGSPLGVAAGAGVSATRSVVWRRLRGAALGSSLADSSTPERRPAGGRKCASGTCVGEVGTCGMQTDGGMHLALSCRGALAPVVAPVAQAAASVPASSPCAFAAVLGLLAAGQAGPLEPPLGVFPSTWLQRRPGAPAGSHANTA